MKQKLIFFGTRLLRAYMWCKSLVFSIDVACISNYRDVHDYVNFGFKDSNYVPCILPWVMFKWNKIRGRLYMINSITEQVAGNTATKESIARARKQFLEAISRAVNSGAKVILLAASTKRLFTVTELKELFPKIIFTIGDNFTSLLLGNRINEAFNLFGLDAKKSKALVIAPYGHLGRLALSYLSRTGCKIVGIGRKKREKLLKGLAGEYGIEVVTSFKDVGKVDIVVACNSSEQFRLNLERVKQICRKNQKLIVVDPCEPPNMPSYIYENSKDIAIRLDAGNGFSSDLKYTGGKIAWTLLRLNWGVIWGCFCEALLITKYLQDIRANWFQVSWDNIKILSKYYGEAEEQFKLPIPTCFNKPIPGLATGKRAQTTRLKEAWKLISKLHFAEGFRLLFNIMLFV